MKFTRVYFREFSEFSGDSGKLNHAKMISCVKKFSRQFTSFLYRNEVQFNWLQTISKPSFWQFKPNLKCLRSLCKFITLEKTIYWKTKHLWPRYMKTAWTCPVSIQTAWWDEILKGIRDATFTPSIKNDGRVDLQVDEQIEQPVRDSLRSRFFSRWSQKLRKGQVVNELGKWLELVVLSIFNSLI